MRRTLSELEKSQKDVVSERKALQERVRSAEQRTKEMYAKLGAGTPELTALNELRQRLAEELDDERAQHQKDLAERDFTIDQTRKKYQGKFLYVQVAPMLMIWPAELAQLSEGRCFDTHNGETSLIISFQNSNLKETISVG